MCFFLYPGAQMLIKDHIHTEYLLTFDMKSNKTESRGLSLVLLKEETPKLFPLLTPFFLLTSPILFPISPSIVYGPVSEGQDIWPFSDIFFFK